MAIFVVKGDVKLQPTSCCCYEFTDVPSFGCQLSRYRGSTNCSFQPRPAGTQLSNALICEHTDFFRDVRHCP